MPSSGGCSQPRDQTHISYISLHRQAGSLPPAPSQSSLTFMPTESVMLSNRLIFCHQPLLLSSIFPNIGVFPDESALRIRWPKYWFSLNPEGQSALPAFRKDNHPAFFNCLPDGELISGQDG